MHWVVALGKSDAMVVAAYDEGLLHALRALRVPAYNYSGGLPRIHFRGTPFLFHRTGYPYSYPYPYPNPYSYPYPYP